MSKVQGDVPPCDGPQHGRVEPERLRLDPASVTRALGYAGNQPTARVAERAATVVETALTLLEPRWLWLWVEAHVDPSDDTLVCVGPEDGKRESSGSLSIGRIVGTQLSGLCAAAVFVVSVGSRLEKTSRELLASGEALDGYLLDAIGSVATEACADALEAEVAASVARLGWRITNRYSPGYCSWPTADQQALFALLPDSPAGITLSESSLMRPLKSISGIIGLGKNVKHQPYPCEFCRMPDCPGPHFGHARHTSGTDRSQCGDVPVTR